MKANALNEQLKGRVVVKSLVRDAGYNENTWTSHVKRGQEIDPDIGKAIGEELTNLAAMLQKIADNLHC